MPLQRRPRKDMIIAAATAAFGLAAFGPSPAATTHLRPAVRHVNAAGGTLSVLHSFAGSDGANPQGNIAFGVARSGLALKTTIFGTTLAGGAQGDGSIFAQSAQTSAAFSSLFGFSGANGAAPSGLTGLLGDYTTSNAPLIGVTASGGKFGFGTIYVATTNGAQNVLYSFTGGKDGSTPLGRLVAFTDGKVYGTTSSGGAKGFGTVFSFSVRSGLRTIHTFSGGNDGANPLAGLSLRLSIPKDNAAAQAAAAAGRVVDASKADASFIDPALYGTTSNGGAAGTGNGIIFKITPAGTFTTLFTFNDTSAAPGATPAAELSSDLRGNLYGTTSAGGSAGLGEVFVYTAANTFGVLHDFSFDSDAGVAPTGATPLAPITVALNGVLYGTTSSGSINGLGNVFTIDAKGFALKYEFSGADGASPQSKLIDGLDGKLYGTTSDGGANGLGAIFSITE